MPVNNDEHAKVVAIKTIATRIVHAKKVSMDVDGKYFFSFSSEGLIFQRGLQEQSVI